MEIPDSHKGLQTVAYFFLTATKSATSAQQTQRFSDLRVILVVVRSRYRVLTLDRVGPVPRDANRAHQPYTYEVAKLGFSTTLLRTVCGARESQISGTYRR